jgi:hypothetical protein
MTVIDMRWFTTDEAWMGTVTRMDENRIWTPQISAAVDRASQAPGAAGVLAASSILSRHLARLSYPEDKLNAVADFLLQERIVP